MNEGTTTRILLVDDHPMMRRGLRDLLELEDDLEMVGEAGNGEDAIRLAQEIEPDLILMDIQLPGMDGLTATGLLKADPRTRAIPVIALTALAMKGDEERIRAAGCDSYLAKPLRYHALWKVIEAQTTKPDA
jgi:CheY-like chemotaxis protein